MDFYNTLELILAELQLIRPEQFRENFDLFLRGKTAQLAEPCLQLVPQTKKRFKCL